MKSDTRRRKRRRKKKIQPGKVILEIIAAVGLLALICAGIWIGIKQYSGQKGYDICAGWEDTEGSTSDLHILSSAKADSFASSLCVGNPVTYYGDLSTGETERVCLMDLNDSNVMYAKNMYDKVYPASITKIMTALLCMEYGDMSQIVTIEQSDVDLEEGSQVSGMEAGDVVTMDQLFHMLLIYSANDCAMAIARTIGGSVDGFVDMMNAKAASLGMIETHFCNPHGLQDPDHYTCAYDVYLMLNEAVKYPQFTEIMSQGSYTLYGTKADGSSFASYYTATDHYLNGEETAPDGVTVLGGKTGTTSEAGACLAILSQNIYGEPFISVILNAYTKAELYSDMNKLLSCIND